MTNQHQEILKAISRMDTTTLWVLLDDAEGYDSVKKQHFIPKLSEEFERLRDLGDTHLTMHPGSCNGPCSRNGENGISFKGNKSKRALSFVLGKDNIELKSCSSFCSTDKAVYNDGRGFNFYMDQRHRFEETEDYLYDKYRIERALDELRVLCESAASFQDVRSWCYVESWIDRKYNNPFEPYYVAKEATAIRRQITDLEAIFTKVDECTDALCTITTTQEGHWLDRFRDNYWQICDKKMLFQYDGYMLLNNDESLRVSTREFEDVIAFYHLYKKLEQEEHNTR